MANRQARLAKRDRCGGIPAPDSLPADDVVRLSRLLERTFGRGFKLVILETASGAERDRVRAWLDSVARGLDGCLLPVEVSGWHSGNPWVALGSLAESDRPQTSRVLLALSGWEDVIYRDPSQPYRLLEQLNVQRDILVRDYPWFWLVLVHPRTRQLLQRVAPDFCDLATLWIEAEMPPAAPGGYPRVRDSAVAEVGRTYRGPSLGHRLLDQAMGALDFGFLNQAADLLGTYDATGPHPVEQRLARAIVTSRLMHGRGQTPEAWEHMGAALAASVPTDPAHRAVARQFHGLWAARLGEVARAERELRTAIAEFQTLDREWNAADASADLAVILRQQGRLEEAQDLLEAQSAAFRHLKDDRAQAVTRGFIADILQDRGETDQALRIRREEQLPVFEKLGDVRAVAVTRGQIADILQQRGETDEALRIWRDEVLPVFEKLGDVRFVAVTRGRIADILQQRGETDEVLRIRREEQLPVYEKLGDVHAVAVTRGKIADILQQRGETNEALRIWREEVLPVFERLGDVWYLLVGRAFLGLNLLSRGAAGDREEAAELLNQARQAAEQLKIPEADVIRQWQEHYGLLPE